MIVTVEELGQTSLYPEIIETITRGDREAAELQIVAAESLCKSYLFKYDLKAAFGGVQAASLPDCEPINIPPTHPCELLKKIVKTIASYYLVRLANPNVDLELYRLDYQLALDMLKDIRDGKNNLVELPYAKDDPETPDDESDGSVAWNSNVKRVQHF